MTRRMALRIGTDVEYRGNFSSDFMEVEYHRKVRIPRRACVPHSRYKVHFFRRTAFYGAKCFFSIKDVYIFSVSHILYDFSIHRLICVHDFFSVSPFRPSLHCPVHKSLSPPLIVHDMQDRVLATLKPVRTSKFSLSHCILSYYEMCARPSVDETICQIFRRQRKYARSGRWSAFEQMNLPVCGPADKVLRQTVLGCTEFASIILSSRLPEGVATVSE